MERPNYKTLKKNKEKNAQCIESVSNESITIVVLVILLIIIFLASFMVGRYEVSLYDIFNVLYSRIRRIPCDSPKIAQTVILKVRTPRILAAMLIGGALSVSGVAYQGLFKNPMVSPDILGASTGAGFGAALAIIMSMSFTGIQSWSFAFGLIATALSYFISIAVSRGKDVILLLVLAGIIVSALFSSLITLIKYVADPFNKLPEITYWLMGSLSAVTIEDVKLIIFPLILGFVPLMLFRWQLNVMAFGDEEAKTMGLNTSRLRFIIIVSSTLLVAASVSICGMIGWIGLVIPHLSRMIVGPNHKILMPTTFFVGSIFLLVVDDIARAAFAMEIPLGILTSFIGAPFFVFLLLKRRKGWV